MRVEEIDIQTYRQTDGQREKEKDGGKEKEGTEKNKNRKREREREKDGGKEKEGTEKTKTKRGRERERWIERKRGYREKQRQK